MTCSAWRISAYRGGVKQRDQGRSWFPHNTPTSKRSVFPEPTIRPPSSRIFRRRRRRHLSAGGRAPSLQSPRPCVRTLGREDTRPTIGGILLTNSQGDTRGCCQCQCRTQAHGGAATVAKYAE